MKMIITVKPKKTSRALTLDLVMTIKKRIIKLNPFNVINRTIQLVGENEYITCPT